MEDRSLEASSVPTDPEGSRGDSSADDYLLGEVAIAPPLDEFRRTYAKKTRSFHEDGATDQLAAYEKAFELGERLIQDALGEGDGEGDAC